MIRHLLLASAVVLGTGLPAFADTAYSTVHEANAANGDDWSWTLSAKVNAPHSPRALEVFQLLAEEDD